VTFARPEFIDQLIAEIGDDPPREWVQAFVWGFEAAGRPAARLETRQPAAAMADYWRSHVGVRVPGNPRQRQTVRGTMTFTVLETKG
jgi:hypothetical protein